MLDIADFMSGAAGLMPGLATPRSNRPATSLDSQNDLCAEVGQLEADARQTLVLSRIDDRDRARCARGPQRQKVPRSRVAACTETDHQDVAEMRHRALTLHTDCTKKIAKPRPAMIPVMIQNRTMTLVSDHPFISKW